MWPAWLILGFGVAVIVGALSRALLNNPRGDVEAGVAWQAMRWYARLVHHLRVEGFERIPRDRNPGPLIIVSNHTAGVDPILIQAVCPFEIRWIMAADMRAPAGEALWQWARVIFVDRDSSEVAGAREAVRHVKAGGVLGIFPEGGLERPPRTILPFMAGVGLIIKRTGAPVLPVIVDGTPIADAAWTSLVRTSRARLRIMEPIHYGQTDMSPQEIADDLRRRFAEWTGWPLGDRRPPRGKYARRHAED